MVRIKISKNIRWAGYVTSMGEMKNACNTSEGKLQEERTIGRPSRR
jgi:hypothetical protein